MDTNISEDRAATVFKLQHCNPDVEAAQSSEALVSNCHTTWLNNPENYEL
jgi:hypothetical protein